MPLGCALDGDRAMCSAMTESADRIISLYRRHAGLWDQERGGNMALERRWLDRFTALLPEGGTVLDIGCGMGDPIGRHLLRSGFVVTGLDASPELIARARARLPEGEWITADMRGLTVGRRFHGLLAWHSSFHLTRDDQRGLFPHWAAHALPGAVLMFTSGAEEGEAIGNFAGEPLYHGSLAPAEYRVLLAANRFEIADVRLNDPECGGASIWLARYTSQNGPTSELDGSA
jgi:SAM-dependent methyltransferase